MGFLPLVCLCAAPGWICSFFAGAPDAVLDALLGAARKFFRVFEARQGDNLQGLGHGWKYVNKVDEVLQLGMEAHSHGRLVNNLASISADHADSEHFVGFSIGHHLDHPPAVAERPGMPATVAR